MNFSFSEILVILLVALLVVKPEQLPEVAFTLGRFAKTLRRLVTNVKSETVGLLESFESTEKVASNVSKRSESAKE